MAIKIRLLKDADKLLGRLLVSCFTRLPLRTKHRPQKLLLIRPGGIGDATLLIPGINAIQRKHPAATLNVLAEKRNSAIFQLSPNIEKVYCYDKLLELFKAIKSRPDVIIDTEQWHRLSAVAARLTGAKKLIGFGTNERARLFHHVVPYSHDDYEIDSFFHLLAPLGIKAEIPAGAFLKVPAPAKKKAQGLLGEVGRKSFITIFPGASIPERRWGVRNFYALARKLDSLGHSVVVVGGKEERAAGEEIVGSGAGLSLAGKTSLLETAAVIEQSALLVSGDSGILHMGVGLDRPTVSLFGPGIAKKWAPRGDKHLVINKKMPCSPCTKFGYTPRCTIKAKCMSDITVDEVFEAARKLLEKFPSNRPG